jgi:hypothetical protein
VQVAWYRIFDLQGREVLAGTLSNATNAIEVSQLPAGVYHLHLNSADLRAVQKFVVVK